MFPYFKKTILIFRKNWILLLLALLVGVFIGFPELFFRVDIGNKYQGIPLMSTDAEMHYLSRINEVYDGYYSLGNVYSMPKDLAYFQSGLGERIIGFAGMSLGLSATGINTLMKFLAPALIFLLVYYFVLLYDGRKRVALISSLVILLGGNLITRPHEIWGLISGGGVYAGNFNYYFRSINPEISSIFLFGYLILFYKLVQNRSKIFAICSGIILGLSFYLYLFAWTFLLVFTFVFLAAILLKRRKELFWRIGLVLFTAFLISLPYWLNFLKISAMPDYQSVALRFGSIFTHTPFFSKAMALLSVFLLVMLFNYFRGTQKEKSLFGIALIFSVFVVYNQQIITGQTIQPGHYHRLIALPLIIIFLTVFLWDFFKKAGIFQGDFFQKAIVSSLAVILLANTFNWQMFSYYQNRNTALSRQKYKVVLDWLNTNARKDNTVFSSRPLSDLIPIFTPLNIYPSGYAIYYLINENTFKNQLFLEYRFRGVTPHEAEKRFYTDLKGQLSSRIYAMRFQGKFPNGKVRELVDDYAKFYAKPWADTLNLYPVDYFIFDEKLNELNAPDVVKKPPLGIITKVAELNQRFLIYKINPRIFKKKNQ